MLAGEYFLMCARSKEEGGTNHGMGRQGKIIRNIPNLC